MMTKLRTLSTLVLVLFVQMVFAQNKIIKGTVTDAADGSPLPGVNVVIEGTEVGAATDFDGNYTIKAKTGQTLVFSFLGYQTVKKKIGDATTINVQMKEAGEVLKAVTINALGVEVKKASQKAVAISNVKAKALQTTGEHDPVAALSGKVSGVNINLASGDPGASTNITIRGPKSILKNNQPLFVVDGVPVINMIYGSGGAGVERPSKIADIDPNNIESIKVIKGGAAAALWGSRGANGVILITTKKGRKAKKGVVDINVTSSYGIDDPLTRFPLQEKFGQGKGGEYPKLLHDFFDNSGSWGDKIADRSGASDVYKDPDNLYFEDQDGKKWFAIKEKNSKETFNDKNYEAVIGRGYTLRNSVQLSTATDKAQYVLAFNQLDQKGIFKNSDYKKVGISFNNVIRPFDKIKLTSNFQYINSKQNAIQKGSNVAGLLLGLYRTPADFDNSGYVGVAYEYGIKHIASQRSYRAPLGTKYKGEEKNGAGYNNPLFTVNEQKNPYLSDHFVGGANLSYDVTEWLRLTAKSGMDFASDRASTYFPVNTAESEKGLYSSYMSSYIQLNTDLIAQINKALTDDINLDFLTGINWYHVKSQSVSGIYSDFILPSDIPNSSNSVLQDNSPSFYTGVKRKNSVYFSTTGTYKDLLYLTLTGRAERASTYDGLITYPSISLAFDLANLDKLKDSDKINQITLRASWSKVGNDPGSYIRYTYFLPAGGSDPYGSSWDADAYGGAFEKSFILGNPDIQPEITTEFEVGADMKFFNNRLSFNVTYYNSVSDDLLLYEKIPTSTGFSNRWNNVARMSNEGIELESRYRIFEKAKWNWTMGGTYSKNKNLVEKIVGSKYIALDGFQSTSSGVAEGYGYGILRSTDFERDSNGNLVLNEKGFPVAGELVFAGDPNPDFKASLFSDFNYKRFKFRILTDGSFGGESWDGTYGALNHFGRTLETANEVTVSAADAQIIKNSAGQTIDNLTTPNPDGTYTVRGNLHDFGAGNVLLDETWYGPGGLGSGFGSVGTQYFRDATWIKLREISLGYTLKGKLFSKTKLKSVYFGITGRNLYLWTKDENWNIDPESNLSGSSRGRGLQYFNHPTTRSFVFTTNINF